LRAWFELQVKQTPGLSKDEGMPVLFLTHSQTLDNEQLARNTSEMLRHQPELAAQQMIHGSRDVASAPTKATAGKAHTQHLMLWNASSTTQHAKQLQLHYLIRSDRTNCYQTRVIHARNWFVAPAYSRQGMADGTFGLPKAPLNKTTLH
jgi:hypothetical protein